jgi:putative transport protein
MLEWIALTLKDHPELAIFLSLGIGYWIGGLKFGSFSLGTVTGTLLAGLLIGQLGIPVAAGIKSVFFLLFLFAVGYGVGPQFVRGIASDGAPQAIFAVVVCLIILAVNYICAVVGGLDLGFAAGMYSGSQTISASIGLATDAINGAGFSAEQAQEYVNHIPVAYAVAYIFGTVGTGLILAHLGPKLLGINLPEECKRYEKEHSLGGPGAGTTTAWHQLEARAFRIPEHGKVVGMTIAEAEHLHPEARVFVEAIRRNEQIIDIDPTMKLQAGDIVAISGPIGFLVDILEPLMEEVADRDLLNIPVEQVNVVVTRKRYAGKTLGELAQLDFARGVYLKKIARGAASVNIPILSNTQLQRGDILTLAGTRVHVERLIKEIGYADRPSNLTDMITVGLCIFAGGLLGAIVLPVFGTPITLSTSGGALVAGLIVGWLRGVYPLFGNVPSSTLWFMNNVGLNMFIAVVGISSGPGFVSGIQEAGLKLFGLGLLATAIPMLIAPLIGKFIFKFDPAINLGCCGGSRTSTASVGMVGEVARSDVPMLGYTVPYAVSNTLLTLWGMVIVLLLK